MRPYKLFVFHGELLSIGQISRRTGISEKTIQGRMANGETAEEAVQPGSRRVRKRYLMDGREYTIDELAEISGMPKSTIKWRLNQGMSAEEAVKTERKVQTYDYHGRQISIKEAAKIAGIGADALRARMSRHGIALEDAVDQRYDTRLFAYGGAHMTLEEIAEKTGVKTEDLRYQVYSLRKNAEDGVDTCRKNMGMTPESKSETGMRAAGACDRKVCAEYIIGKLIAGDAALRPIPEGWALSGDFCTYAVEFIGDDRAALVAYSRLTKRAMMRREYMIDNGKIWEVAG